MMGDESKERTVYLALKNVFMGPNAQIRQLKAIRRLIDKCRGQSDIKDLIRAYTFDSVCTTAQDLLKERIFESTVMAKLRFPEIFDVSPAQSAAREASKVKAAKAEANAIHVAVQCNTADVFHSAGGGTKTESVETCREPSQPTIKSSPPTTRSSDHYVPSLFPAYLPLRAQHRLLVKVQALLEQACFDFVQRAMPDLLHQNEWDCPESAELNRWAAEFLKRQSEFASNLAEGSSAVGKPLDALLRSVGDIRHTAVHRIRVSAEGIEQFVLEAEAFATLLGDSRTDGTCIKQLTKLRRETQFAIEELERNKHVLGAKLEETRKRIAAQRAELDRLEKAAIAEMLREDGEYQVFAGANLEQAVLDSEVTTPTPTADSADAADAADAASSTVSDSATVTTTDVEDETGSDTDETDNDVGEYEEFSAVGSLEHVFFLRQEDS